jgi:luciferase family oxidoreductase group 1
MIGLPVSVLDFGIVREDAPAGRSVTDVVALARRADELRFRRFWVAEHHGSPMVSGGVPAVVLGRLVAETTSIRVGAGGVMLPNYAPVAVAEQFGTLARRFAPDELILVPVHASLGNRVRCLDLISERVSG